MIKRKYIWFEGKNGVLWFTSDIKVDVNTLKVKPAFHEIPIYVLSIILNGLLLLIDVKNTNYLS